jgi:hypothetical protein
MPRAMATAGGAPQAGSPPRRAGSVRRTTSHVTTRPSGLDGPAVLYAAGRDLLTLSGQDAMVIDALRLEASADYLAGTLLSLALDPAEPRLDALVDKGFFSGFRGEVLRALPGEAQVHSLRYQLLDDLPVAIMGNGRSLRAAGRRVTDRTSRQPPYDLCAGYARGGTAVAGFSDDGPPLSIGPAAADPALSSDPLSWHAVAPLTTHATCRIRRLDVWREGEQAVADCFFRDSHCDRDGRHTVVHEWSIVAEIDPSTRKLAKVLARPGPLPYPECPGSAGSAQRLAGLSIDGLRHRVRQTFTGPQTCSHLNDSFRALEDIGALLDAIPPEG